MPVMGQVDRGDLGRSTFFEERRGMLYGFRWRDRMDFTSSPSNAAPLPDDQAIGIGDGANRVFQLTKTYGGLAPYVRVIAKPVAGAVRLAVNGDEKSEGADFAVDTTTGLVTFTHAPANAAGITAGFRFERRCGSIPTIWKSISRLSRPATSRRSRWSRLSSEITVIASVPDGPHPTLSPKEWERDRLAPIVSSLRSAGRGLG